MATAKKPAAKRGGKASASGRQDRNGDGRVGRGPGIARETAQGKPTAYAVMKDLWTARGTVKAHGIPKKFELEDGPIAKAQAINILKEMDKEDAAPFVLGPRQTLVPVGAMPARKKAAKPVARNSASKPSAE